MFLFRSVFILATVFVAFVAQVSAIPPLTRFMLDAIPDGSESGADANIAASDASASDTSTSVATDTEIPTAVGSSPVDEDPAIESSSAADTTEPSAVDLAASSVVSEPSASAISRVAQANAASAIGVLGSTSVLVGSVVAGIVFAI